MPSKGQICAAVSSELREVTRKAYLSHLLNLCAILDLLKHEELALSDEDETACHQTIHISQSQATL